MRDFFFGVLSTILLFMTIIAVLFFSREKQKNVDTKIYSRMIVFAFLTLLTELILFMLGDYVPITIFLYISKLFVGFVIGWFILMAVYSRIVAKHGDYKINNKKIYLSYAPIFLIVLLLPVEFIKMGSSGYVTGPATAIGFMAIIACLVVIAINIFKSKQEIKKNRRKFIPLIVLIIMMTISTGIQAIYPEILLFNVVISTITFIMYNTIENPDVKMVEKLDIAKNQAEKANRAKTEFLSSMSHEIRTPLNAIVGFSDYIMTSESLDEAKENAQDIVNASKTLLEIVNGILDISKIEAGKMEIVNSKYNAKHIFEGLAKLVTPKMNEKGLDFTYYIAPDLPETLFGDHANIKKVVTNLLSNAYKYTERGAVRYEVNCINSGNVSKLIITVEDTGRGIKQESIDKLFTKFQRLDEDRNTTIEGTGLGLAITKQLIELMGGKILVHTVYGEGSKFTVVINQTIEKTEVVEEKVEIKTTLDLKDKRILLVDDNSLNIKVATKILERFNANNITSLDNGFDCIDLIKSGKKFDIILMDDMMPKMSGVETFHKLKELEGFNQPVVILTANAIAGMKEKYLSEGFEDYLAKPIEKDELIRVCNTVFAKYPNISEQPEIVESIEIVEGTEEVELLENTEELEIIGEDTSEPASKESYLKENGVDLDKAIELLGDIEMYDMTISDFLSEVEDKWQNIINYKNTNDMENYAIEVHSLKSDAKYLGFMSLADISYQHELKSKENDSAFVNNHFNELEVEYNKTLEIVKKYNDMIK